MFNKQVMNAIRKAVRPALKDSAEVFHGTETPDSSGAPVLNYPVSADFTTNCLVEFLDQRPVERVAGQKVTVVVDCHIHFPAGSDIRRTDRLKVTYSLFDQVTTQTFEVVRILAPETYEALRTAYCKVAD